MTESKEYEIVDASPEDASLIAWAVMEAVGEDIVRKMAGEHPIKDVEKVFTTLAGRDDSQYSYQNSRIALSPAGEKAGVCVSYNGGDIKRLRRSFFEEAKRTLGWEINDEEVESLPCETTGEEFYLDSLAILPQFRGKGYGSALISDARSKAARARLLLGLLVADHNPEARRLYESLGFRPVGRRWFAGEEMTNMRIQ